MLKKWLALAAIVLGLGVQSAISQAVPAFSAAGLVKLGDSVRYGSYEIFKIGEGIYQLKDQGDPRSVKGGLIGADMYIVLGKDKALMIDLGNNYMIGYKQDEILPRKNAKEEFLAVVDGLVGKLPLEATLTHAHPDHDGMTMALIERKVTVWMPKGEDLQGPKTQHGIDPAVYTSFDHQTKTFDLGGGRVLTPLMVRGHTLGCATYLMPSDDMIFTGDCLGIGAGRSLRGAESLKMWSDDTQKLVDYIKATLPPYQRYGLKVYTGHSVENVIPGFLNINHGRLDLSYLDWRFLQDQALCGNAILKGQWLNPESGLHYMEIVNSQTRQKVSLFTFGIGAVEMPVAEAFKAAGIKMYDEPAAK